MNQRELKAKLNRLWEERPLELIATAAVAATAASKVIDSMSNARSRKTWAKEVDRRVNTAQRDYNRNRNRR